MSIRLTSRRGAIGRNWHAAALRDAAETILGVGRAGSGKADARAGRVQWLDIETGIARGDVLDADGHLYQARVDLPPFSPADREAFVQVARTRPDLPTRLAGGEYPQDLEAELARCEVSLLPRGASELSHDCSCLDWPGPCRHVAALVYVLVEEVDERPVQLLTLRGLALEDLVPPAGARSPAAAGPTGPTGPTRPEDQSGPGSASGPEEPGTPEGGDGAATRAGFNPARMDPALLAEVIGDGPAAAIASFYRAGAAPSDQPTAIE
ncbi:SWIM zinc finger family protein [Brachybacterium sp. GCM10030267]|uniref:SWIM zinc finger family protein n=1 Tax=Brachybacterium sp. GCM10030267 TaxID=3273381 RepID=UPI0036169B0B